VVAMEVGDEHRGDLAEVEPQPLKGGERGCTAVKEHRVVAVGGSQMDARLVAAAGAEGVAAAGEGDGDGWLSGRGHCPIVAPATTSDRLASMSTRKARVIVTHWVHPEVRDYLSDFCDAVMPTREEGVWPRSKLAELAADASGLMVCMADSIDHAFLEGCRRLRVVSATLKGYDNFDAEACARQGVWLTIVPDDLIAPTAELAIGLMIGLMRRIAEGHEHVRGGDFAGWRPELYGSTLEGATVGVAGMGQLGQAVARRLAGFGSKVRYHDTRRLDTDTEQMLAVSFLGFAQLAQASDVMVLTLPLTGETRHLVNASLLLRSGAFLVNVGRGSVVSEEAVADALEAGHLGGYAADVFAMEDWALPGHPARIPDRLLRHPRTLFTPHLGSAVDDVRRRMSLQAAHQVRQVIEEGQPPDHAVNRPRP
jgi:phosphonate dehydrogenase